MEPWAVTLLIGLLGGGGIWQLINRTLDKKDGTRAFQKEMREELKDLHREHAAGMAQLAGQIETIRDNMEMDAAISARVRIIRFSDEIMRGVEHSQESFDQALHDIDTYEDYCADHPKFENNKTVLATRRIKEVYEKCLRGEKQFL